MKWLSDSEWRGNYGRFTVGMLPVVVRLWDVQQVDPHNFLDSIPEVPRDFPVHNVSLSLEWASLDARVQQILMEPVSRVSVRRGLGIDMNPEIHFKQVQLFNNEDDALPEIEFDDLRVVRGPMRAGKLLVSLSVNLTPLRIISTPATSPY